MLMHTIEVDGEVFAYLKQKAEPFVDTPNSVLRRELLNGNRKHGTNGSSTRSASRTVPSVAPGTPKALEQLLQVAKLVTQEGLDRTEATRLVAKSHGVAPQTVNDKYGRQAGLDAASFDRLLAEPGLVSLRAQLRTRFPRHHLVIDELLTSGEAASTIVRRENVAEDKDLIPSREPLTHTVAGYLRGSSPSGEAIVVWHREDGRTGYQLHWKGQWYDRFAQNEMERHLGIEVRTKKSGTQEGYPAEAVIHAAWRFLVDRYNAGDARVEYSRTKPSYL